MPANNSVTRAANILELLSQHRALTLTEISNMMGMPKASTSDILKALTDSQLVEFANVRAKTYKIGVKLFLLGNAYLQGMNIVEIATPFMEDVADRTKYVVFLAKLSEGRVLYLHKTSPVRDAMFVSLCQVGSTTNLTTSALGKVILAHNDWLQEQVFSSPLPKVTENSITDIKVMEKEMKDILHMGYARDLYENDERITCFGFPVYDQHGRVVHAISITGTFHEQRDFEKEIELGLECAKSISLRLGFVKP
ncbi:MAG: IclR family transcriptional regulator [Defluviitaleaceae bacterium]|nr:IclR family transcriptional regulator [Defluviitaleaceae bacterium]